MVRADICRKRVSQDPPRQAQGCWVCGLPTVGPTVPRMAARQLGGFQEAEEGGSRLHAQVTPPVVERSQGHWEARGVTQVELLPQSWDQEGGEVRPTHLA